MASQDARLRGASIRILMDEVVALNEQVSAMGVEAGLPTLISYRWRVAAPDLPSIYNLIGSAPLTERDQILWSDEPTIITRIAVAYGDDTSEMGLLEEYTDIFRQVWDPAVTKGAWAGNRPFNGAAIWANRTDMRSTAEEFNGIPAAAMEFSTYVRLDRTIV